MNNVDCLGKDILICECQDVKDYLTANSVDKYDASTPGRLKGTPTYVITNLTSEILGTLIKSGRTFNVGTLDNLKKHVQARISSINAVATMKAGFGKSTAPSSNWTKPKGGFPQPVGDPAAAINGWLQNPSSKMDCNTANRLLIQSGTLAAGGTVNYAGNTPLPYMDGIIESWKNADGDWVPGDGGRIQNNNTGVGNPYNGEYILYLGNKVYYGNGIGQMSLDDMKSEVQYGTTDPNWCPQCSNKAPTVEDYRRYSNAGINQ